MKKLVVASLLFLLLFSSGVFAAESIPSVETVLMEILSTQGISNASQINCGKVSDLQFEELGDSLMEQMHPGAAHETMDAMMGGEGSESLKAVHVSMGKSYLHCFNGSSIGPMGPGMMGPWMMQWATGSGGYWQNPFYLNNLVFWVLLVASIALNIYLLFKRKDEKK